MLLIPHPTSLSPCELVCSNGRLFYYAQWQAFSAWFLRRSPAGWVTPAYNSVPLFNMPIIGFVPFRVSLSLPTCKLPGIISQINYLHQNHYLSVWFWWNPDKTRNSITHISPHCLPSTILGILLLLSYFHSLNILMKLRILIAILE